MRDFNWCDELYAVVKENGNFAGVPCRTHEEARELSAQHEGSCIFRMKATDFHFDCYEVPQQDFIINDSPGYLRKISVLETY